MPRYVQRELERALLRNTWKNIAFMTQRQFPTDTWISDCLRANYSLEAHSITPLSGGADMNAALYQVHAADHSSYFVKLKLGLVTDIQATLLELLHGAGIEQVIPPIKTIYGHAIVQQDHWSVIVYPFIEGVNGFSHKLTDQQWITLGKALRKVHEFSVPSPLLQHIRKETYSPKYQQIVRSLSTQDAPPHNDAIALAFLSFLSEHKMVIERLVTRAEQLSNDARRESTPFVLCHSDIHGGNVLLKGGGPLYIVDWDDPIMAPKERDLMFIGGGVANVWNDPKEETLFYKGYGETDINTTLLAYYRHERIVEDIAEYGQALLLTKPGNDHEKRSEMYKHFVNMFDPRGVVDIAFTTDKLNTSN